MFEVLCYNVLGDLHKNKLKLKNHGTWFCDERITGSGRTQKKKKYPRDAFTENENDISVHTCFINCWILEWLLGNIEAESKHVIGIISWS